MSKNFYDNFKKPNFNKNNKMNKNKNKNFSKDFIIHCYNPYQFDILIDTQKSLFNVINLLVNDLNQEGDDKLFSNIQNWCDEIMRYRNNLKIKFNKNNDDEKNNEIEDNNNENEDEIEDD